MHLSEVNQALQHKIVGGSEHQWTCWDNARFLDYESDYAHASVVFNIKTQEVYTAEINDKENKFKPYRWLNPSYKQDYIIEHENRGIDYTVAWDETKWYDLETSEDWLTKASAIMENEPFDDRVTVPLDLGKEELFELMVMAHERDITLNEMVASVLQSAIDKIQSTEKEPAAL